MRFGREFLIFAREARKNFFFVNPCSRIFPHHQVPLLSTSRFAGNFKQKLYHRRFDVAAAKVHVGLPRIYWEREPSLLNNWLRHF